MYTILDVDDCNVATLEEAIAKIASLYPGDFEVAEPLEVEPDHLFSVDVRKIVSPTRKLIYKHHTIVKISHEESAA